MSATNRRAFLGQLLALTFSRLLINTALRLTYPFLPVFARGLGVPLGAIASLVAARNGIGLLSPLFSPISERAGRRVALLLALLVFGAGCLVVVLFPAYWPFAVTLILISVAKVTYDPAMQAYLGDVVPYRHRGKAIAATELSWAGALLLGAPLAAVLIARQGWYAPFAWLGVLGLGAAVLLRLIMPPGRVAVSQGASLRAIAVVIRRQPVIWAVAGYVFLFMAANELLWIVFGAWLESSFALDLASLGLAAGLIGGAEIAGEVTVGLTVDRFGKRPVVITTGLLCALCYLAIPIASVALVPALVLLFLLFLMFEITVVGGIPLITEVFPRARSVVLSVTVAAAGLGRMAGALVGPHLWRIFGLPGVATTAALVTAVAMLVLILWVFEDAAAAQEV